MEEKGMSLARPAEILMSARGQIMCFLLTGSHLPPLDMTVRVAMAFRSAALAAFHLVAGNRESFLLSGHQPDGRPDLGHRHGFYLPTPDQNGRLATVRIVSPFQRFSPEETEALKLVRVLRWNGPATKLNVELSDEDDFSWNQVAAEWSTLTPYVPPRRFYGTHGKHHLLPGKQLIEELRGLVAGDYQVVEIHRVAEWQVQVRLARGNDAVKRPLRRQGWCVRFRSSRPLCGPVVLGHSAHFGLGQFRPVSV
jgi:CRISPR-associated protein Csb2